MIAFYFVFALLMVFVSQDEAHAQADLSQTKYVAVDISWQPNPANEQVEWYIIEYNDEGLSDNTWSVLRQESVTTVYVPFTELIAKASRANGKPPVELTDELCVRIVAARGAERSSASQPACFTMLHDTQSPPDPTDPPAVLSAPSNVSIDHKL